MTTTIDLSELSFESAELMEAPAEVEEPMSGDLPNPVYAQEFEDMGTVYNVFETITARKHVCRDDMERIQKLAGSYPSLERLLKKYPLKSFSLEPSRINYDVSTEGIVRSTYEAVIKALKDVLTFIAESIAKLWDFLTANGQKTAAVDDLEAKLKTAQIYILEVDRVMTTTRLAEDFRKVREGAFNNEFHNLSKKWNTFRVMQLEHPDKMFEALTTLAGVVKTKLPPFVDAVDSFLTELTQAETEADIKVAIAKMELLDMTSGKFIALASSWGYKTNGVNKHANMTDFQSTASFIKGMFKSWLNERPTIDKQTFSTAVTSHVISPWSGEVSEVISWAKARTVPAMKKVAAFNATSLKPGMEDLYMQHLVPFFKAVTSILSGFTAIEQCMGSLTDNRNNVAFSISNAAIGIVKKMDGYILANKDKLTIAEQNVIWRHRKAVSASFGK